MKSKNRRSKNRPSGLSNIPVAPAWERNVVPNCWLPADLSVVGEADLDVRIAVVLIVAPELEQAVNVPQAVGGGSSS